MFNDWLPDWTRADSNDPPKPPQDPPATEATMEAIPSIPGQTRLAELRRRRAELLESMRAVEQALAAPAPGREGRWAERVRLALGELSADFRAHIDVTEGPDGLYADLRGTAPRLSGRLEHLAREHVVIADLVDNLLADATEPQAEEDVDKVRELGTALLATLLRHRQRGSDLIYEAYEADIGGET